MGSSTGMKCRDCNTQFMWSEGGGFTFHLLHCDQCGAERSVPFEELGAAHTAWLKGSGGVWSVATAESDRAAVDGFDGEAISDQQYDQAVSAAAGACSCGGHFAESVPPTCPSCRSRNVDPDEFGPVVMYD